MTDTTKQGEKKTLTLSKKPEQKKVVDGDQVRQSFSHGRSKTVEVEVRRKKTGPDRKGAPGQRQTDGRLTDGEMEARIRAVQEAVKMRALEEQRRQEEERLRLIEEERLEKLREEQAVQDAVEAAQRAEEERLKQEALAAQAQKILDEQSIAIAEISSSSRVDVPLPIKPEGVRHDHKTAGKTRVIDDEEEEGRRKVGRVDVKKTAAPVVKKEDEGRRVNRAVLTRSFSQEDDENGGRRSRSLASIRRAKQKHKGQQAFVESVKVVRDVIIPDAITVGELANRMAVRGADVIKSLMKSGMMVTINQTIDGDTAELICTEYGHNYKRVSDLDIEFGLKNQDDDVASLHPRAPVVTVMGHVDHGKTSLLDALRQTDVVSGEAGGITQHIGAYQVRMENGKKITFIDTPGHAAFTEMRARGATVTDIVVLVVAADDGIMEQTIEAISHAKAAQVPIVVAINKVDKPDADPDRVRHELLQHGVVLEEYGGDVMSVEVSAKKKMGLDKLEEAILLQAEILELKANPDRAAEGVVIEAQVDRGRGTVATVLIQKGTLRVGDIFIAGSQWGRVRALMDDHGRPATQASLAVPAQILGFNGVPSAGDEFIVVESENKAREIADFRQRREKDARSVAMARGTMEQMMSQIAAGEVKELGIVIKTDVQGSLEAITTSLAKLGNSEVMVRVLHGAVGGVNESDITLARASSGLIIGFNVRANPQAREMARRDGVDIRYYSIIYDVINDITAMMGGMLAPTIRENYIGMAEIRDVFNITKVGKVAGCYITEGVVKRGAKVRLLRDNVVIHEGALKTLKRFKDEVKEVKESYECGMAFENYNDIRVGDMIECFELETIARSL